MLVKTIEEIRRENLAALITWAGGVGKLAIVISKSQSQISQLLAGSPDTKSKTGKAKEMGSKVARHIEIKCEKERGWMDHEEDDQEIQMFKKLPPEIRSWILEKAKDSLAAVNQTEKPVDPPAKIEPEQKPKKQVSGKKIALGAPPFRHSTNHQFSVKRKTK